MCGIENVGRRNFNDICVQGRGIDKVVCQEIGGFVSVLGITVKEFVNFARGCGCARSDLFLGQSVDGLLTKVEPLYRSVLAADVNGL